MNKMDAAMQALEELFGDTSVSREKTLENLETLIDRAQGFVDTLNDE